MFVFRMISRTVFLIFTLLGGIFFLIPKWLIMGTRGSRERRKIAKGQTAMIKQQKQLLVQAKIDARNSR
jgi:hypothetical protein